MLDRTVQFDIKITPAYTLLELDYWYVMDLRANHIRTINL